MTRGKEVLNESQIGFFPFLGKILLIGIPYYLTAKYCGELTAGNGIATPVWPPSGIAFAALAIAGLRYWPIIFIAAFINNLSFIHSPFFTALMTAGDTIEAIVGVYLFNRFQLRGDLSRTKDILGLIIFGALFSTLIDATYGTWMSSLAGVTGTKDYFMTGVTWWTGDMTGDLIIAPLILVWAYPSTGKISTKQILEGIILFSLTFLTAVVIFHKGVALHLNTHLFTYYVFPFLLWAGFRFNQRVVATLTFMIAAIGVQATLTGNGPFIWNGIISSILGLLPFLGILSTSALLFTAVVSDQRRSQQNLARAIKSRDDLLAVVSHDLKNPLSSVLLNLEFLTRSAETLPIKQLTEKIAKIKTVAKNMQTLIGNVLDTALNDDDNNLPICSREDSPKAIIDECVEMLKPLAEAKSITLKTILNLGRIKLRCDHEKIIRVLSNLVGNAIKFTPCGGNIVISVEQRSGKGLFAVRDTGKGIDSKEIPHLFDRFWQVRKKNKDGTGLGLSIAKRIVEAHHGEIWVKSMPGVGTIFYFTLPLEG